MREAVGVTVVFSLLAIFVWLTAPLAPWFDWSSRGLVRHEAGPLLVGLRRALMLFMLVTAYAFILRAVLLPGS
jgi:hypothetical protein